MNNLEYLNNSRSSLTIIRYLDKNWNGYGADPIPETIVNRCWLICLKLKYQPSISPTARQTIQFEYELEDKSYLEFEIYNDKIEILCVEKEDYNKSIKFTFKSKTLESITRDMNLIINLFYKNKFDEIRRLVEGFKNDQN